MSNRYFYFCVPTHTRRLRAVQMWNANRYLVRKIGIAIVFTCAPTFDFHLGTMRTMINSPFPWISWSALLRYYCSWRLRVEWRRRETNSICTNMMGTDSDRQKSGKMEIQNDDTMARTNSVDSALSLSRLSATSQSTEFHYPVTLERSSGNEFHAHHCDMPLSSTESCFPCNI